MDTQTKIAIYIDTVKETEPEPAPEIEIEK